MLSVYMKFTSFYLVINNFVCCFLLYGCGVFVGKKKVSAAKKINAKDTTERSAMVFVGVDIIIIRSLVGGARWKKVTRGLGFVELRTEWLWIFEVQ
jgi:hypothetical protein